MKIFMAGCDDIKFAKTVAVADHPYCLASYYNGLIEKPTLSKTIHALHRRGAEWIMDSGLFTMMFGAEKDRLWGEDDLWAYTDRYLTDMTTLGFTGTIVEMDVHKVLGLPALKRFRDEFEKRWPLDRTVYVWHREELDAGWVAMAKRYPYVALSVPELRIVCGRNATLLRNFIARKIATAREVNPEIKIHLLGCTDVRLLIQPGWTTCDSSSWLMGGKFARGFVFNGDTLLSVGCYDPIFSEAMAVHTPTMQGRLLQEFEGIAISETARNYILTNATNITAFRLFNLAIAKRYGYPEPFKSLWSC